jgi:hypothetical protein
MIDVNYCRQTTYKFTATFDGRVLTPSIEFSCAVTERGQNPTADCITTYAIPKMAATRPLKTKPHRMRGIRTLCSGWDKTRDKSWRESATRSGGISCPERRR